MEFDINDLEFAGMEWEGAEANDKELLLTSQK